MKFKKILILLTSLTLLTSCSILNGVDNDPSHQGGDGEEHVHTFDNSTFQFDDQYHWHPSTCGHDVVSGKEKHTFYDYFTVGDDINYIERYCSTCCNMISMPSYGCRYELSEDKTHYIVYCVDSSYTGDIIIRDNIDGIPVTEINQFGFGSCAEFKSITIPNSITSIGQMAFENVPLEKFTYYNEGYYAGNETNPYLVLVFADKDCKNFVLHEDTLLIGPQAFYEYHPDTETIVLNDKVTFIGNSAFSCPTLTSITLPETVISIPFACFYNCIYLPHITLPSHITEIGDKAFYNCYALEEIEIPGTVTSIGIEAFYGCKALKEIFIPDNVSSIGDFSFLDCESLMNIDVANGNTHYTSVGGVLYDFNKKKLLVCPMTKSSVDIPNTVEEIYLDAFYQCENLTSIKLPNNLKKIDRNAFALCRNITEINCPDGLVTIEECAFTGCWAVTTLNLNGALKTIGKEAFANDIALTDINYDGTVAQYQKISRGANCYKSIKATRVVCSDGDTNLY